MTKIHNAFQTKTRQKKRRLVMNIMAPKIPQNAFKIVVKLQITNFKNITKMHNNGKKNLQRELANTNCLDNINNSGINNDNKQHV